MRASRRTRSRASHGIGTRGGTEGNGRDRIGRDHIGRTRVLARMVTLAMLVLATGIGLAGPAAAHNVLISSDPTDGATLQTAPAMVKLTFDQPVQDFEPIVSVIGPDGQHHESGAPVIDSTVVTASVGGLPVAGAYSIAYRIVSADGHPVEGEIRFQLAEGTGGTATSAGAGSGGVASTVASGPAVPAPATEASASAASGLSGWVWAAIAVAAVLVAAAVVVALRKPGGPN